MPMDIYVRGNRNQLLYKFDFIKTANLGHITVALMKVIDVPLMVPGHLVSTSPMSLSWAKRGSSELMAIIFQSSSPSSIIARTPKIFTCRDNKSKHVTPSDSAQFKIHVTVMVHNLK
jgi:hypothetical protein